MTRSRLDRVVRTCARLGLLAMVQMASSVGSNAAPAWWILYAANGDLWETNGSRELQLTHDGSLTQPSASAEMLVYVRRTANASDIWLANATTAARSVTHNSSQIVTENHWSAQPVIEADGAHILMLSDRDKSTTGVGDLAVWELDLQQTSMRQLTHPPEYTGGDQDPTPSPVDARQLIYTRYRYDDQGQLVEELDWLDVGIGQPVALTPPDKASRQATFAPLGDTIAFTQTSGSLENLYVAQLDMTTERPRLIDVRQIATGVIAQPVWRPDGAALAYLALVDRKFQLFTLSVERGADGRTQYGQPHQFGVGGGMDATARPVWLTDDQANDVREWLTARPAG
jgi:Tol biopolymer transport system component